MTQPQFASPPQQAAAPTPPAQRPTLKQLISESGAGGKYFPFLTIGDTIEGQVLDVKVLQARDLISKELKFWSSGDPMWNVVPTVQTTLRDPQDPEDGGERSIYIKWSGAQRMALQQALNQAGVDDILVGGWLKATYVGDGPAQKGLNAPKLFEFIFRPPAQGAGLNKLPQGGPQNIPQQYAPGGVVYAPSGGYATGGIVPQPNTYSAATVPPNAYPQVTVHANPGLFTPEQVTQRGEQVLQGQNAPQYVPPGTPRPPAPQTPPPPQPQPVPAGPSTAGDLAAQFQQIKAGLDAGMSPSQIVLMVPGVDMATVQAIATAPNR